MKPLSALLGVVTGALVTTLGSPAFAADFSLRGTFAQDDDVHLFNFRVATESTVTLRTYSYGGGTQTDGTVIAAGGFDPILSLFNAGGMLIGLGDDDASGTVANDPTTGQAYDSLLRLTLAVGNYTLALTQYDNFSNTTRLADGFRQEGNGNYTSNFSRCTTSSMFCDFTGDIRTNRWAFDALGVFPVLEADEDEPPVDEPPVDEPPVDEPPVDEPPVDEPPVDEPPVDEPPVDEPPVDEPPVIEPPVIEPPIGDEPTAVPEPTTTVVVALTGLGALVKLRRQR